MDRRLSQELLNVISPLGVEASLKAIEELDAGETAQRTTLSSKLEQLDYEANKAFEQYDVVDARNRLVAAELERRWNEKLEEIDSVRQRLASVVRQADCTLCRAARPRLTFSRMSEAVAVQMKGVGCSLCWAM